MKRTIFFILLMLTVTGTLFSQTTIQYELPKSTFADQKILKKTAMQISFSVTHKQAYWVAYPLSISKSTKIKRTNKFVADPEITKTGQASNADYKKSGYDKGHLAPAADMSWSLKTMTESFYFSNMSPQKPQFNRVIWKNLAELVRTWAQKYGKIYIATGPILDSFIEYIGKGKIGAPTYFYKTILYYNPPKQAKAIAFIMKNEGSTKPLSFFAVSVDELEKRTNIDFFYQLPDDVENKVEAKSEFNIW
jgi:endonuclease G, mitochondrial